MVILTASLVGLLLALVAWPRPRPRWRRWLTELYASVEGANRSALKPLLCQQNVGRMLNVSFTGQGAAVPLNAEGDPNAVWVTITRQGVGQYTLTTKDPWAAVASCDGNLAVATIAASWSTTFGKPAQTATKTWTITVQTFSGGVATDVILNDILMIQLVFRDSLLAP